MKPKAKKGIYREVSGESHYCRWYKDGKRRVLVDTVTHEVIAHNPLPLLALGASLAPSLIEGAVDMFSKKKKTTSSTTTVQPVTRTDNLDKPNKSKSDEWAEKILRGEMYGK
jgi:hypothetical protein